MVTVAILTFNGASYLEDIFDALETQVCEFEFETLVIDSGSTDSTLEIIRKRPNVRLHEIPNSEFGHGRTRNLAAQLAQGKFIAFLTHDAIPASEKWLSRLVEPLQNSDRIAGVLGRQIPRDKCIPMLKYEIAMTFARQGANYGTTISNADDLIGRSGFDTGAIKFYSDVNSATRVDFLRKIISYRDVDYAEDQMFAEDFMQAGFSKAYSPDAAVIHSNDLTIKEIGPRTFDETLALRKLGHVLEPISFNRLFGIVLKKSLGDANRIRKDHEMKWSERLYWLVLNPQFIYRKWRAYNAACTVDFGDVNEINRRSLESQRKSGN